MLKWHATETDWHHMIFFRFPRHSLAAAIFVLPLWALSADAASDEVPDMQMAQSVPVWEPGDPLPGSETSAPAAPAEPEEVPAARAAEPVLAPPLQLPNSRPAAATPVSTPALPAAPTPAVKSAAEDPEDFLCTRAPLGKAAAVPQPFDRWLVRVCAPQGQALVPVLGEAWVAHGSADPVSILAMPPDGLPPPVAGTFDARYDIRFVGFEGGKTEGARRDRATELLKAATGGQEKLPAHDEAWQLDALSNVDTARYNIFFYLAGSAAEGGRPNHIIVCLDQCRQALYLDVLRGAEAKEVLGE